MKTYNNLKKELELPSDQLIEDILTIVALEACDQKELYEAFDKDSEYIINEGIVDILKMNVKDVAKNLDTLVGKGLKAAGLHRHKSGKGIIQYLLGAGKGVGKMVLALLRGDTQTVKDLASTVTRAEVMDFLIKLDTATLHLISGPLHTLDAITGWHIAANIENIARGKGAVVAKIKGAITTIRASIANVVDKGRVALFHKGMDRLEAEIGA